MKYCYSTNEEDYTLLDSTTRKDAIEEARELVEADEDDQVFWVGEVLAFRPAISGVWAIEHAAEQAYDEADRHSEEWLQKVTREQEDALTKRLTEAFEQWMIEFKQCPTFFTVGKVEEFRLAPTPVSDCDCHIVGSKQCLEHGR